MVSVECTRPGRGMRAFEGEGLRSLSLKSSRVEKLRAGDMIKRFGAVRERDGRHARRSSSRASSGCVREACLRQAGRWCRWSYRGSRCTSSRRHVAALWRAVDDASAPSIGVVERLCWRMAGGQQKEFAVVLEALREAARKTFDPRMRGAGGWAFRSVAVDGATFYRDSPHSLPTRLGCGRGRYQTVLEDRHVIPERLDRNCDGVVSRSELGVVVLLRWWTAEEF